MSNSVLFFQRRPRSYYAKVAQIQSGWAGQVLAKWIRSRSNLMRKNHQPQFWQNATGPLPDSNLQTRLHPSTDSPDSIVQNQPRLSLALADCARFRPNGSHPETSQCARIIRPVYGRRFPSGSDANQFQHVHWATGCLVRLAHHLLPS